MPKTTKRARKFIAKGGTTKAALERKRGAALAKRGKAARRGKKEDDGDGDGEMKKEKERREEEEERERRKNDFLSTDGLGNLDMESFFEKAAGLADDEGSGEGSGDDDDDDGEEDGSVDSFSSLPSEEEDLEASEAAMKATLEKMSEDDPDFHKYLRENESSLLEFEEEEDDDDDESEGGEDDEKPPQKKSRVEPRAAENKFLLTPLRLQQLEQGAFGSHSVRGLKRIIAAYRTACHLSDAAGREEADHSSDEEDVSAGGGGRRKKEFQITSPAVFDRLMAVCLARCHEEFHYHLLGRGSGPGGDDAKGSGSDDDEEEAEKNDGETNEGEGAFDENKPLHPKKLSKSPRFLAIRPLLESFLRSTHHLLAEGGKEAKLLQFVLSSLSKYVPYLSLLPKLAKTLLKTCVRLWSGPSDTSEEHNAVRLRAFLRIRQLAVTQPYPFVEDALKLTYLSYARRSRFGTAANVASVLPTLTFMGNCIVELYSLDYASAYQHAFVYIRQLALHLRTAVMKRTEEAVGVVLCWQYVHCLKLWTAVLSAACGGSGGGPKGGGKDDEANLLRSLVYPLTEVILGTCRLANTVRFVPLRLHCVRLLQQLAASSESFIPTTSMLLGVLDAREVGMRPLRDGGRKKGGKKGKGKSSVQGLRLPLILKLPKEATLRTTEQLDGVLREVFVLLNREADLYRYSPGFPEFAFTVAQRLRKFNKGNGNGRWRAYAKGTVELCEKYSKFATEARATLVDAPKDVARLEALRPAGVPSMRERYEAAAAKERRLEAAARPATKKGNDAKAGDEAAAKGGKKKKKAGAKGERKRKGGEEEGANDDDSEEGEEGEEGRKIPKPKKNKKKKVVNEADLKNVEALKEEDEVQEGVEWSDSE